MSKFKNRFRVESARLSQWDYSIPWWYYITINTKNHIEWFGKIDNGKMILNDAGAIAQTELQKTAEIRDNITLDYFIIMPNHIHAIIIIEENDESSVETRRGVSQNTTTPDTETCRGKSLQTKNDNDVSPVETRRGVSLQQGMNGHIKLNEFSKPIKNSLSIIINQIKGSITRQIRQSISPGFAWQPRFYDRIIRDENELQRIRQYINDNPLRWDIEKNENLML